ncbi:hypothetical protein DFH94DRAFT_848132 [Russula ochroleuca]|uniref:Uncharacterized protein n=1 Tax=Russula ochroleuca TaxID=152965 RepID=A0A9P5JW75_9AGAM|nr:hypothetical protein DFH94DRAFT_848132 [Russula ochroleuca]
MMIHFLTSSISIDRLSLVETRMMTPVSPEGGDGVANDGGTNLHTFAKDGETLYLVADMLAHSPPLPLVIDFDDEEKDFNITAEDEEGIILALGQRDRVRRVRLEMRLPKLKRIAMVIEEEFPVLESLIMAHWPMVATHASMALMLPETFQAPHLRHLLLSGFVLPIGSRLLMTAVGLVTLALFLDRPPTYIRPNVLLQWISSMPQLEALVVAFLFPVLGRDVERQLMHTPIMTNVTLPNLRSFMFQGVSAYMEAVVCRITTPHLERLDILFFNQLTFSVPRLPQFMNATQNFRFDSAKFTFFGNKVYVKVYPREEAKKYAFQINVPCWHLDWQVSSVAQIFNSLSQTLSTVEHLILAHMKHSQSSEEHNEVDRTEWHKLLRLFSNAKTLHVDDGLVEQLSCGLRLDDGEHPLELLPELQELTYSGNGHTGDAFTSFIDARQNAGRPVTLIRPSPRSVTPLSRSSSPGVSDVMTGSSEGGLDA